MTTTTIINNKTKYFTNSINKYTKNSDNIFSVNHKEIIDTLEKEATITRNLLEKIKNYYREVSGYVDISRSDLKIEDMKISLNNMFYDTQKRLASLEKRLNLLYTVVLKSSKKSNDLINKTELFYDGNNIKNSKNIDLSKKIIKVKSSVEEISKLDIPIKYDRNILSFNYNNNEIYSYKIYSYDNNKYQEDFDNATNSYKNIINTNNPFRLEFEVKPYVDKYLEIKINISKNELYNFFAFKMRRNNMLNGEIVFLGDSGQQSNVLLKSELNSDFIEYEYNGDEITQNNINQILIKLNLPKNSNSKKYTLDFQYLYLTYIEDISLAEFETREIYLENNPSIISIEDPENKEEEDIEYYIKIEDSENWKKITPINFKRENDDSNKVITRTNYEDSTIIANKVFLEDNVTFFDLSESFLNGNQVEVFQKNFKEESGNHWIKNEYYESYFICRKTIELDFGSYSFWLDNKPKTGIVTIEPGIHHIKTNRYEYLFDWSDIEDYTVDNTGLYTLKLKNSGSTITVQDNLWPYNHKHIIENNFGWVFENYLIENVDYKFVPSFNDTGSLVDRYNRIKVLKNQMNNIYVVYKSLYDKFSYVRFKVIIKKQNTNINYINIYTK